jgi:hypothetical protein
MAVLPFDTDTSHARRISPDGSVIYEGGGFMWDEENGVRNLRDVLISNYGLANELEGWQLAGVTDTSRDGRTLVGRGTNPAGDGESWIAVLDPLGDMNSDGEVNGLDVDPFVEVLLSGPYEPEADMNDDQVVNGLDVDPFVTAVVGDTQAVPEPSALLLCIIALGMAGGWCLYK